MSVTARQSNLGKDMSRDHDSDPFEEFAPRNQGFSLLRTRRQTVAWYARSAAIPAVVGVVVLAVAALAVEHSKTPRATTSTTTTTSDHVVSTTTPPRNKKNHSPSTTTTQPHVKKRPASSTTTTVPKRPVTTTTRPTPTTTIFRPPTTTTKPKHPTTTTTAPKESTYSVTFTCAGGETVTVSGTGPTASNSLTVDGPIDNFASGATATVSFTAIKGTYVATDTDASGGAFVNYISSPSTCS